ncbi:MAG TPA: hypothetical protein VEO54_19375 [Thermoanaerobaculia bacterium]|nr:hypothetical protein [Thermoanaerobaculia bacterium]
MLAVLLLLATTLSAQSQNVDVRLEPLPRGTFIVEFQRAPGVAAAATLERFRRDVPATFAKGRLQAQSAALAIRHEYAHVLLGAASRCRRNRSTPFTAFLMFAPYIPIAA